jgi:alkanesulfonate monooxygenase SsuD/methylene tetrahydromethanopterin reductase-like flavin-dependent oxidoreductase (luciferase family)
MDFRVLSLGDWLADPVTGKMRAQAERFHQIIALAERAEALGFGGFHLGEHHFSDYILSSPVPLLSAIAMRTSRIRLSTGVTLLANRDPVHIAEDYATLDLISKGRAELVAGRGNAFFDTYRQMGHDITKSRERFDENLALLLRLWNEDRISWQGTTRAPLDQARVEPRPYASRPPVWIGGGSSEDSVRLAAQHRLDLHLPGVYAPAPAFAPLVKLYRELHPTGRIAFTAHVHVREDGAAAKKFWEPYHTAYMNWVWNLIWEGAGGKGQKPPPSSAATPYLDAEKSPALCGNPSEVANRLIAWNEALGGIDVMLFKFDGGAMPDDAIDESMSLVAGPVSEKVRAAARQKA